MEEQKAPKEILKKHYDIMCEDNREDWAPFEEHGDSINCMLVAMQEYSDQQNAELRERVKELEGICEYALKAIKEVYSPFGAAKPIIKRIEKTLKK